MVTLVVAAYPKTSYIVIDEEKCKGCHLCIAVCPNGVIGQASHINRMGYIPATVIREKAEECTGCTVCAIMCPDTIISVYRHDRVSIHSAP